MEFDATFLIAIISFIVFVFIMNKIFYAPILRIMQERQKFIEENFTSSKINKSEILKKTKYHDDELEKNRDEARSYISEKSKIFKQESSNKVLSYKNTLYENINKEKDLLKQSAIDAKEVLKDNLVDIAKDISYRILGEDINKDSINKSQIDE